VFIYAGWYKWVNEDSDDTQPAILKPAEKVTGNVEAKYRLGRLPTAAG